jgi:hypothetical protein
MPKLPILIISSGIDPILYMYVAKQDVQAGFNTVVNFLALGRKFLH